MKTLAFQELIKRYCAVFKHAWANRRKMEPEHRQPHELQFLPAALSLQETPVSPAPRVAMWALISFAFITLLWALFGRIDVVATAQGKIVPNDRIKTIQPLEVGVVQAIHVTDGQTVKAGEVLLELDETNSSADTRRFQNELINSQLQVFRAQAMLSWLADGSISLQRPPLATEAQFAEAESLLQGLIAEYQARQVTIRAEIAQKQAELVSTQEQVQKLEHTLPIVQQRAEDLRKLAAQDFVPRHRYLEQEQLRIEQQADLDSLRSQLNEIKAALQAAHSQKEALFAETQRIQLDTIVEGQKNIQSLQQELKKSTNRNRRMQLTAPVDGTVQQLMIHTIGGVVTPAQALMVIVPQDNPLEIEAFIENKDIGFVYAGQPAEVKIETFQYTKYGTLPAEVSVVSHDAISDEQRGLIYSARIQMKKSTIAVGRKVVNLTPGMAVTVEIKTGKRRVIEYFLSPLMQHVDESLRER